MHEAKSGSTYSRATVAVLAARARDAGYHFTTARGKAEPAIRQPPGPGDNVYAESSFDGLCGLFSDLSISTGF
jgi:hypothetical protein